MYGSLAEMVVCLVGTGMAVLVVAVRMTRHSRAAK
jgi:hypothetical protein